MSYTNNEAQKVLIKKINELEENINSIEKELMKKDNEFDRAKVTFHFGRLESNFIQAQDFMRNLKYI